MERLIVESLNSSLNRVDEVFLSGVKADFIKNWGRLKCFTSDHFKERFRDRVEISPIVQDLLKIKNVDYAVERIGRISTNANNIDKFMDAADKSGGNFRYSYVFSKIVSYKGKQYKISIYIATAYGRVQINTSLDAELTAAMDDLKNASREELLSKRKYLLSLMSRLPSQYKKDLELGVASRMQGKNDGLWLGDPALTFVTVYGLLLPENEWGKVMTSVDGFVLGGKNKKEFLIDGIFEATDTDFELLNDWFQKEKSVK